MNLAHVHLILNHVPVMGTLFGLALLLVGMAARNATLKKAALALFVVSALAVVPVYLTGEPAEHVVERSAGVADAGIGEHEAAAKAALAAGIVLGLVAFGGLAVARRRPASLGGFAAAALVLGAVTGGMMAFTANLGGQIRHTEIRAGSASSVSDEGSQTHVESGRSAGRHEGHGGDD